MTRFRGVALQLFKTKSPDRLLAEAAAPEQVRTVRLALPDDQGAPLRAVATTLLRYFAPQVFLLGVIALTAAVLNARRNFATPAFSPVVNNVVTIVVLLVLSLVLLLAGLFRTFTQVTKLEKNRRIDAPAIHPTGPGLRSVEEVVCPHVPQYSDPREFRAAGDNGGDSRLGSAVRSEGERGEQAFEGERGAVRPRRG